MDIPFIFDKGPPEPERLELDENKLRKLLSKLLPEFNLEIKYMERTREGDIIIVSHHFVLNKDVRTLLRAISYHGPIEREDIEDLQEDMLQIGAINGILITSSYFTKDAQKYAKHLPIRLVDGAELIELLEEHRVVEAKGAFLPRFTDEEVIDYFENRKRERLFGLFPSDEKIVEIDRRYIPLAQFRFRQILNDKEIIRNVYVDLHSGDVLYLEEDKIMRDDFIRRIMDLPQDAKKEYMDLIRYGELKHKYVKGKTLNILERKGLVIVQMDGRGDKLNLILDEISDAVTITTSEISTPTSEAPKLKKREKEKQVRAIIYKPEIDISFDLEHFMEFSKEIKKEFDPDPINYKYDEILDILQNLYKKDKISYDGLVYLPYYKCKYVTSDNVERYDKLIAPKFKPFMPKFDKYLIYRIIDKFPAIPYLFIAIMYLIINLKEIDKVIHIFSSAFIFLLICIIVGILLKIIFKTERRIPRYTGTIAKYGFPSIHSMASIGGIAFVYFVNPFFALLLIPLGLLYVHSRISLKVHSEIDVLGGAIIGIIIGIFCGIYILKIHLPYEIEILFSILFFIVPLAITFIELRMR
ncbi:MAG: hypothetical protein DRO94_02155 [Candidatus Altiarchaeales archaeon]|nr:MAG: hypothetical protein DRO94_02155 [Candidatus Altiarchaeales archaeon]